MCLSRVCCFLHGTRRISHAIRSFLKNTRSNLGFIAFRPTAPTVHDLLYQGYCVCVPYDAVSSRKEIDYTDALDRAREAGAVIGSVESAVFELLEKAGTPVFKRVSKLIK